MLIESSESQKKFVEIVQNIFPRKHKCLNKQDNQKFEQNRAKKVGKKRSTKNKITCGMAVIKKLSGRVARFIMANDQMMKVVMKMIV